MVLLSGYFCLYYNLLLTYILHYLFASFKNPLPWVGCNHSWNTDNCFDHSNSSSSDNNNTFIENATLAEYSTEGYTTEIYTTVVAEEINETFSTNSSMVTMATDVKKVRASEEYWK